MSMTTETRSNPMPAGEMARLHFRLPTDAKEVIERAAIASGQSMTDFAVASLLESAHEVLERQHQRKLSDRDRDLFLAMLDEDAEPNDALRSAFEAHDRLIAK